MKHVAMMLSQELSSSRYCTQSSFRYTNLSTIDSKSDLTPGFDFEWNPIEMIQGVTLTRTWGVELFFFI